MKNYETCSDESLVERLQRGDDQAFSVLVRRHNVRFYKLAYRMCADEMMAQDIVQDGFLKIWECPQRWDSSRGATFLTWFYRVITNLSLDFIRKRNKVVNSNNLEAVIDGKENAEIVFHQRERKNALEHAIQALPERQKAALNLCFYEEMTNKQAADVLDVNVKALESLLMRAKANVREHLVRLGVLEDEKITGKKHNG